MNETPTESELLAAAKAREMMANAELIRGATWIAVLAGWIYLGASLVLAFVPTEWWPI